MKIEILNKPEVSNLIVASARTCYNSRLFKPDEVKDWFKKEDLLLDLFKSGHHTTFMHTNLNLVIEGVSRGLVWRLLHSHKHYNSDQVSQRYVEMKSNLVDLKNDRLNQFQEDSLDKYNKIVDILGNDLKEDARYLLPQSVKANLYHTINLITALRYIAIVEHLDVFRDEAIIFGQQLESILIDLDPIMSKIIDIVKQSKISLPNPELNRYSHFLNKDDSVLVFDISKVDYMRTADNNYYDSLNINSLVHDSEGLDSFLVRMRLSLACDSQNQRHRASYGVRPLLLEYFKNDNRKIIDKYYVPASIKDNKEAYLIYIDYLKEVDSLICEYLLDSSVDISYLIPNSYLIEIIERNDFSNFIHKSHMRMCLNAQSEILDIHYDIVKQLKQHGCDVDMLSPICVGRAKNKIRPFCTEGDRFCGVRVWENFKIE